MDRRDPDRYSGPDTDAATSGPDSGMASVWAVCAVAALLALTGVVWTLGAVVLSRHRAAGAADLAALAAAGSAVDGVAVACGRAEHIGMRMRVRVRECRLEGWDALVVVEADVPGSLFSFGPITVRARAGPVPASVGNRENPEAEDAEEAESSEEAEGPEEAGTRRRRRPESRPAFIRSR